MSARPEKPRPTPSEYSQPYWDGLAVGELRVQRCSKCHTLRHYPRLLCNQCYSDEVGWQVLSGNGHVHSWTVAHHPYHPAFADEVPYVLVLVDLDEGPRALGRWRGEMPIIGQAVHARVDTGADVASLVFAAHGRENV